MKKKSMRLASACLVFLLLVGCSAKPSPKEGGLDPEEPTSITVWTYYNGAQLSAFATLVSEFNETAGKEQGIFVETYSQGSVNDLEKNVLEAARGKVGAGEVPNVFAAYADTAYAIDQMGLAVDLTPYLTDEERAAFVESYIEEGRFSKDSGLKIFPVAKSTEIFMLNQTDWDKFSAATGATQEELSTVEGLVDVSQRYYEWTDSLTEAPNDGKAFFGRDAMANYFLIGAMQLGCEILSNEEGGTTLNFDREVMRRLWDNYYVPYIKGYFAATGRFRSDDIKTGNILSFVGSSSGATFFPREVIVGDTENYPIEMAVLPCPPFENGLPYAVQQGAGMVVTTGTKPEVEASVQFLKWLTDEEHNIAFSMSSGYLPVKKSANDLEMLRLYSDVDPALERILKVAIDTVNHSTLYTPHAFEKGTDARALLEHSVSDLAAADRATVLASLQAGQSLEDACAPFLTDAYFEKWYNEALAKLTGFVG